MTVNEFRKGVALTSALLRLKNKPIAYISGKVTGLPIHEVKDKFNELQVQLEAKGYVVFNPTKSIKVDCDWQLAMRFCIAVLPLCDSIHMLHDWEDSRGAREELRIAELLGLQVFQWQYQ